MAIVVERNNQKSSPARIILAILAIGLLFMGTYYVFFATAPFDESIEVSEELDTISEISAIKMNEIDPSAVIKSINEVLEKRVGDPELGEFGRENPFSRF
jgi:hypothetical protein